MSANKRESWKTIQEEIPAEVKEGLSYCSLDIIEPPILLDGEIPDLLSGIYFLYGGEELQYIGQSENIKRRFQCDDHSYGEGTAWVLPITSKNWRGFVEALLIQQFRPPENKRIPRLLKDDEPPPDSGWPLLESAYPDIQDNITLPMRGIGICSLAPINLDGPVMGCTISGLKQERQNKKVRLEKLRLREEKKVLGAKIKNRARFAGEYHVHHRKSFAELVEEAEEKELKRTRRAKEKGQERRWLASQGKIARKLKSKFKKVMREYPGTMSFLDALWRLREKPAANRDNHIRLLFEGETWAHREAMKKLAHFPPPGVVPDYVKEFFATDLIHPTLAEIQQRARRFSMDVEREGGLIVVRYHKFPVFIFVIPKQ